MKNRNERLMEIRRLIASQNISSQDELMKILEKQGYEMTQATLSRDLKYLKVAKMPDNQAGYVYILPDKEQVVEEAELSGQGLSGLISLDFAQGMAILRTLPGHASSIAYTIDNLDAYEIAGTIAGDDTILLIPRDLFDSAKQIVFRRDGVDRFLEVFRISNCGFEGHSTCICFVGLLKFCT